jgi:hypothetical protein
VIVPLIDAWAFYVLGAEAICPFRWQDHSSHLANSAARDRYSDIISGTLSRTNEV